MSCHKKCVTKCQNSTVCGPVDCTTALQGPQTVTIATTTTTPIAPEFTISEVTNINAIEQETELNINIEDDGGQVGKQTQPSRLEVHRQSLSGLLAQSLKRVNSANNLAIPGIVTQFGGNNAVALANSKSLPPSPQHSPRFTNFFKILI